MVAITIIAISIVAVIVIALPSAAAAHILNGTYKTWNNINVPNVFICQRENAYGLFHVN